MKTEVKLLPYDHEVMGSSPGNNLLQKCRPKVIRSFLESCACRSYIHLLPKCMKTRSWKGRLTVK
jgi:hypothetical protein